MFTVFPINDLFSDPGVYLEFKYRHQALLFDLGDIHRLTPRQILKIDYIFVSHTHMDHFIGFDHLLRICLGRDKRLHLFGPRGFLEHVSNRLLSYNWNLVNNYANDLAITAVEIDSGRRLTGQFSCKSSFQLQTPPVEEDFDGVLIKTPYFTMKGAILDHRIPVLAFRFEEESRVNIKKNALLEMSLPTGPWLMDLKELILKGHDDTCPVRIWWRDGERRIREKWALLGELRDRLVVIKGGRRLGYITDALGSPANAGKIVELVKDTDQLFIEATFLHGDIEAALKKSHLTARQAGALAREAGVKNLNLFHFSPKYRGQEDLLNREADRAFRGEDTADWETLFLRPLNNVIQGG